MRTSNQSESPRIRRLACTTTYDELECSADHTKVTVDLFGIARCANGHTWTGQRDAYGRESHWQTSEPHR